MANNSGSSSGLRELLDEVVQQVAGARPVDEPETRLAIELEQLRTVAQVQAEAVLANTQAVVQNTVVQDSGGSGALAKTGRTVLGTLAAGLSPVITGLARLFTGEKEPEPTPLVAYVPPPPVNYSGEIRRAARRGALPSAPESEPERTWRGELERRSGASPAAQVTVQVQAMDSRSFLDHSDEIARAVREAMLRSHSLNDVVNEL